MKVEVFDDWASFVHTAAGALSYFAPVVFIPFIFYEIIEHMYRADEEKEASFLGDIVEYLFGLGAMALLAKSTNLEAMLFGGGVPQGV